MISYATYGVRDIAQSVTFYEAALAPLGYVKFFEKDDHAGFALGGDPDSNTVWLGPPYDGGEARPSNGHMVGFAAPDRAAVQAFHAAALAHGGSCEGPPGVREQYGPDYYLAYVRDPVGNKMAAMYRGRED